MDDQEFITSQTKIMNLLNQTEAKQYRDNWIRTCLEHHFPPIIVAEIEKLLRVDSKNDISRVLELLYRLRDEGVSAVWETIKPAVIVNTRRVCGTIFPDVCIAEGVNLPIAVEVFGEGVTKDILKLGRTHELLKPALIAQDVNFRLRDAQLKEYLLLNPPIEKINPTLVEEVKPSISEKLMSLGDSIDGMLSNMTRLMSLLTEDHRDGLFAAPRPTLGCEPPSGSIVDSNGNTKVPKF